MITLLIEHGSEPGKRQTLIEFPIKIGRDPHNDVVLNDEEVSRFHLRIKQRGRLYILEDLDSRNGTFLNGDRTKNAVIKSHDRILLGGTQLIFLSQDVNVEFADSIMQMDVNFDRTQGIQGPIAFSRDSATRAMPPERLESLDPVKYSFHKASNLKTLIELQAGLLSSQNLEDCGHMLLKGFGRLWPSLARAALFTWSDAKEQLMPIVWRQFQGTRPFSLNQAFFEEALSRKQAIVQSHTQSDQQDTSKPCMRLVIPIMHGKHTLGVAHLESDVSKLDDHVQAIVEIQALLSTTAPNLETFLLRSELDHWSIGMIETIVSTIEAKDTYTHGHSERVSRYCAAMADQLQLDRDTKRLLIMSSLCHDVGKVAIPDHILKKASMLTHEEYIEMKQHPIIGAQIINFLPNSHRILSGIKYHHEKWDGTGYPDGLVGESIPFFGRIVALADAYDAMVSGRSYSGFMEQSDAVEKLNDESDLFDPEVMKAFNQAFDLGFLTIKTSTQSGQPVAPEDTDEPSAD